MCAELLHLPLGMMDLQYLLSKLSQCEHLANLGRELLQDILRYLHRVGLVVWYEEIEHLESTVFLQPTFLITMFKVSVGIRTVFSAGPELCSFAGFLSLPPLLAFSSHSAPCEVPPSPAAREHLSGHADWGTCYHQRQVQLGVDFQVKGNAVPQGCACLGEAPALFRRDAGHL